MTRTQTLGRTHRAAPHAAHAAHVAHGADGTHGAYPALPRRERRAVSYCNIWDLVAPGEPCPTCEDTFEERLARARSGGH